MGIGEASAAGCELVYVRRVHASGTIAGEVTIAHIVGHDDNDIGFGGLCLSCCSADKSCDRTSDARWIHVNNLREILPMKRGRVNKKNRHFFSNDLGRSAEMLRLALLEKPNALFFTHFANEQSSFFFDHNIAF